MKNLLSVLFCFFLFQGASQNYFDVVNFTYTNAFSNDFEVSNATSTVDELNFDFTLPIVLNKKTVLLAGAFANKTRLNLDPVIPRSNLHVLGLNLGINRTFNDKWSATFMAFPKIATDVFKFSKDNFQLGFLSLFTHKKRDNLKYKYGLFVNTEEFGIAIVPIIGLYYMSANKKFEANLNLPINADINYRLHTKFWVGMKFDGIGTTYNLNKQNFSPNGAYVVKNSNELVSYVRFKLNKSLLLNTKFGFAVGRNYKVYDANEKIDLAISSIYLGDDRTQLNEPFKDGAVFKLELVYRLHFD